MTTNPVISALASLPGVVSLPSIWGGPPQLLHLSDEGGIAGTGGEYVDFSRPGQDVPKPSWGYSFANSMVQCVTGGTLDAIVANRMAAAHASGRGYVRIIAINPEDGDVENRLMGATRFLADKFKIGIDFQVYVDPDRDFSLGFIKRMRAICDVFASQGDGPVEFSFFRRGEPNWRDKPYPVRADILYDFNLRVANLPTASSLAMITDYHNALRPPEGGYDGGEAFFLVNPTLTRSFQRDFADLYGRDPLDIVAAKIPVSSGIGIAHMQRVTDTPLSLKAKDATDNAPAGGPAVYRLWRSAGHLPIVNYDVPAFSRFIEGAEALFAQNIPPWLSLRKGILSMDSLYEVFRRMAPAIHGGLPVSTAVAVAFGRPAILDAVARYGDDWNLHAYSPPFLLSAMGALLIGFRPGAGGEERVAAMLAE